MKTPNVNEKKSKREHSKVHQINSKIINNQVNEIEEKKQIN